MFEGAVASFELLLLQVLFREVHNSCSRFNADKQVTVNAEESLAQKP